MQSLFSSQLEVLLEAVKHHLRLISNVEDLLAIEVCPSETPSIDLDLDLRGCDEQPAPAVQRGEYLRHAERAGGAVRGDY